MFSFRHRTLFIILILSSLIVFANQCGGAARRYPLAGIIISVDQSKHQLVVSHSDIPGFMPAMVMPFNLKDANALNGLSKGDEIAANLVVNGSESWLEDLRVLRKGSTAVDARDAEIRTLPHEGDVVPDFILTNQDGKKISLQQYRAKRCSLPSFTRAVRCRIIVH